MPTFDLTKQFVALQNGMAAIESMVRGAYDIRVATDAVKEILSNAAEAEAARDRAVQEREHAYADKAEAEKALADILSNTDQARREYAQAADEIRAGLAQLKDRATMEAAETFATIEANVKAHETSLRAEIPTLEARVKVLSEGIETLESRQTAAREALDLLKRA